MSYLRPGFPRNVAEEGGNRNIYEYRGPTATMKGMAPARGALYLDGLPVDRVELARVETSGYSDLTVETFLPKAQVTENPEGSGDETANLPPPLIDKEPISDAPVDSGQVVNDEYPYFEIEWVSLEKPLRQHPAFADFAVSDWNAIELWEKEPDGDARSLLKYWIRDKDGATVGSLQELGTGSLPDNSPQDYAKLRLLGVEAFIDAAPVARKTSKFGGNNMPEVSDAGQKAGGDPFPEVPGDYEWLKTADRASKQGRGNDWLRQEEWTGARKILLDKDEIFLT